MLSRRAFLCALGATCTALTVHAGRAVAQQWQDLVDAATAEARLSLITLGNTWGGSNLDGFLGVARAFEHAFPGITVEVLPEASSSVWLRRVRQERASGVYAFDLALVQPRVALEDGLWAPLRPLLVRPDILDDAAWRDGLAARFLDLAGEV
ncbi:MAG TPA: hypothetical protein VFG86_03585, partial [Chloroflexota bacterium]|nr:hypothetical protein [Chloroflexota bacterium]